jgi:dTDP-4-dehydrorhamnose 3,5-epimerase
MIPGVLVTPLKIIPDERGKIMHMLKQTDPWFQGFGEIYFSVANPGMVKAWRKHQRMTINLAAVLGTARVVVHDDRDTSAARGQFQEIVLGPDSYQLVTVAPGLWTGYAALSAEPVIMANCTSLPHEPAEVLRREAADIPYNWNQPTN